MTVEGEDNKDDEIMEAVDVRPPRATREPKTMDEYARDLQEDPVGQDEDEHKDEAIAVSAEAGETPMHKGRRAPRRKVPLSAKVASSVRSPPQRGSVKKRTQRGKRKAVSSDEEDDDEGDDGTFEEEEEEVRPVKRGRKSGEESSSAPAAAATTILRRSGRERKPARKG